MTNTDDAADLRWKMQKKIVMRTDGRKRYKPVYHSLRARVENTSANKKLSGIFSPSYTQH